MTADKVEEIVSLDAWQEEQLEAEEAQADVEPKDWTEDPQ